MTLKVFALGSKLLMKRAPSCYNYFMNKYVFKGYEPIYPQLFEEEKNRLRKALDSRVKIEHFGSTAIPGLGGKGIIDIYVTAPKDNLLIVKKSIEKAGYEFRPDAGTPERLFFRRIVAKLESNEQRYHIHLTNDGNPGFIQDISFRDYLRSHPEDLNKYAEIKVKAAAEANNDKDAYMKIKEPFIQEILAKLKIELPISQVKF
jgi:GrpB-like predicted nucleotidyltransferase (UPF0157 family)